MLQRCLPSGSVLARVLSLSALAALGCSSPDTGGPAGQGTGGASVLPAGGMNSAAGTNSTTTGGVQGSSGTGTGGVLMPTGGSAGMQSVGGQSTGGQSGGGASTGGSAGSGAGSSGAAGAGTSGAGGGGGVIVTGKVRTGMSAGCSKPPPGNDSSTKFILHEVHIAGLDPV
ncbi:MAG TPA: hypothetical protein VNG33_05910, partial [Polyangiaceae bacterium]|nr:hypothetical protein [Polyangiaceae bacterium]